MMFSTSAHAPQIAPSSSVQQEMGRSTSTAIGMDSVRSFTTRWTFASNTSAHCKCVHVRRMFPPRFDRFRVLRFHLCGSFPPATPSLQLLCADAHEEGNQALLVGSAPRALQGHSPCGFWLPHAARGPPKSSARRPFRLLPPPSPGGVRHVHAAFQRGRAKAKTEEPTP
jgi:hypothetical protein